MKYLYKKNGAGDVYRKKENGKYYEFFYRGVWMRDIKGIGDIWSLPNLKEITEEEAIFLTCKSTQKNYQNF